MQFLISPRNQTYSHHNTNDHPAVDLSRLFSAEFYCGCFCMVFLELKNSQKSDSPAGQPAPGFHQLLLVQVGRKLHAACWGTSIA